MRTLFITYSYLGGHGGGVYASRTHINLFANLSERMTLLYPYRQGEEPLGIHDADIEMVPIEDHRSKPRKFFDLLRGKVHRYVFVRDFLASNPYDLVVFDSSVVSSGLVKKYKRAGMKVITIHHNYQVEYLLGDSDALTLLPTLFWTYFYERQAVKCSDLNITLTQQDVELLKMHYDRKAKFATLGVFEYQEKTPIVLSNIKRDHRYVITGGLGAKQTEDSILRWVNSYFNDLLAVDPYAKVIVAGSNPTKRLSNVLKEKKIELIPSPSDMDPILRNADYYLCPVDCGGGLKLRNMDGLKYGLPVLTHVVSARGYEKMQDKGLVISYNDPDSFKTGIHKLLNIKESRPDIQKAYWQLYQFDEGVRKLESILRTFMII